MNFLEAMDANKRLRVRPLGEKSWWQVGQMRAANQTWSSGFILSFPQWEAESIPEKLVLEKIAFTEIVRLEDGGTHIAFRVQSTLSDDELKHPFHRNWKITIEEIK